MIFSFLSRARRRRIRSRPFPPGWLAIVERNVPLYRFLSPEDRSELLGHALVLLEEKRFEGCGGLVVTEEMKVTVAASAALLLLHRETAYYPLLSSIVLYPDPFMARYRRTDDVGVVTEVEEERLGESWDFGTVVLSWEDILIDRDHCDDGFNVILHEFAHQLDDEDGIADGTPSLPRGQAKRWAEVMEREFARLDEDSRRGIDTFLDPYGAESPAEFFAVVTETFFEMPLELKAEHPELYAELQRFYRQDPLQWSRDGG